MGDDKTAIKTPVRIEATKEYGGDVVNMSGVMEVGYWSDRYAVMDADDNKICEGIREQPTAENIALCINEHAELRKQVAAAKSEAPAPDENGLVVALESLIDVIERVGYDEEHLVEPAIQRGLEAIESWNKRS